MEPAQKSSTEDQRVEVEEEPQSPTGVSAFSRHTIDLTSVSTSSTVGLPAPTTTRTSSRTTYFKRSSSRKKSLKKHKRGGLVDSLTPNATPRKSLENGRRVSASQRKKPPVLRRLGKFMKSKLGRKKPRRLDIARGSSIQDLVSQVNSLVRKKRSKEEDGRSTRRASVATTPTTVTFKSVAHRVMRQLSGASELLRMIRLKQEEYVRRMEELLRVERSERSTPEHPYVALRRKIEDLAKGIPYHIAYRSLHHKPLVRYVNVPLYATGYLRAGNYSAPYTILLRYIAPTATLMAFFISLFSFPAEFENIQSEEQHTHEKGFWYGLLLGLIPFLIILACVYMVFRKSRRKRAGVGGPKTVKPPKLPLKESQKEKKKGLKNYWRHQPRWLERRGAIVGSKVDKSYAKRHKAISVFNLFDAEELQAKLAEFEAKEAYKAHVQLRDKLRSHHRFLKAKLKWIRLIHKMLGRRRITSIAAVVEALMRRSELDKVELEVSLVKKLIQKSSSLNVTRCTSRALRGLYLDEQEILLLDNLINGVNPFIGIGSKGGDTSGISSRSTLRTMRGSEDEVSSDTGSVTRLTAGKSKITEEEILLDLTIRVFRALDFPCEDKVGRLLKMREKRSAQEWEVVKRFDGQPQEFFLDARLTRANETPVVIQLRIIVLPNAGHFVLKRLPEPKPRVFQTTPSQLQPFPGESLSQKLFHFALERMRPALQEPPLERLLLPLDKTPLLANLDAARYNFIDPIKTGIIVLLSEKKARFEEDRWRWITPRLRRVKKHAPHKHAHQNDAHTWRYVETSIAQELGPEVADTEDKTKGAHSDIIYHPPSEELNSSSSSSSKDVDKTHKSSSSSEDSIMAKESPEEVFHSLLRKPRVEIVDETKEVVHVTHLTESDWRRRKAEYATRPLQLLPLDARKENKKRSLFYPRDRMRKTLKFLEEGRRGSDESAISETESDTSLVPVYDLSVRAPVDYSNLRNDHPSYRYESDGRSLRVVPLGGGELQIRGAHASRSQALSAVARSKKTAHAHLTFK